jgi:ribosomal peptide maturation radical SAM protein 1
MSVISLVSMPFAGISLPSIGLTQLKAVVRKTFGNAVRVEIHYLNHDFVDFMGGEKVYSEILSLNGLTSGLGDWIFRHAAFTDAADNTEKYFARYFMRNDAQTIAARNLILDRREKIVEELKRLMEKYELHKSMIVGFTSFFSQSVASLAMARLIKERNQDVVIAMGGANCEPNVAKRIVENAPMMDFMFAGPALKSFPLFMRKLMDGDRDGMHSIGGVFSKKNRPMMGKIGGIPEIGADSDIDDLVELDYDDYLDSFEEHFAGAQVTPPSLLFETSRGCWWGEKVKCLFCGLNGGSIKYKAMSPDNAVKIFDSLFKYADRCKRFDGVDNIAPASYFTEVFPRITAPEGTMIFYEIKTGLDEKDLLAMSRAGVKLAQPGIEALATSTLKLVRKGTTSFKNVVFLMNACLSDVYPIWNLLIGFPGEAEATLAKYHEDIPKLTHLPPPMGVYPARFDRFSEYFDNQEKYGLNLRPYDYYGFVFPFGQDAIRDMAYYFVDFGGGSDYTSGVGKWHDKLTQQMDKWIAAWRNKSGTPPKLHVESVTDDSALIFDSRRGVGQKHEVSGVSKTALDLLITPMSVNELAARLGASPEKAETAIMELDSLGLLFEDEKRYVSLVLRRDPAPFTYMERLRAAETASQERCKAPPVPARPALTRVSRVTRKV